MHAHAFKSTLPGCYLLWGHWSSHLVHPISVSLVGARASGLQFTGPPSMCWVIYYAMLPRMETQSQRQRIKQHSAAPLTSHPLLSHSAFLQACPGRQTHQAPALAIFSSAHGTMPHLGMGLPRTRSCPSWVPAARLLCPCLVEEWWALGGEYS